MRQKDEADHAEQRSELALTELDDVSGGNIQLDWLNAVKQIYAPWANMHFGRGRVMLA